MKVIVRQPQRLPLLVTIALCFRTAACYSLPLFLHLLFSSSRVLLSQSQTVARKNCFDNFSNFYVPIV